MSPPVLTCRLTDSLSTAAQLMWEQDCGSIPVTDDEGRLVGIVTDRDIFCHATEPLELADAERRPIGLVSMSDVARDSDSTRRRTSIDREVTHVLAGISQPRSRAIEASP